jgi:hypothetical protein
VGFLFKGLSPSYGEPAGNPNSPRTLSRLDHAVWIIFAEFPAESVCKLWNDFLKAKDVGILLLNQFNGRVDAFALVTKVVSEDGISSVVILSARTEKTDESNEDKALEKTIHLSDPRQMVDC